MRLLFISSRYDDGIGGHAAMLASQLQKRGHSVDLLRVPHIPVKNLKNPSFAVLASLRALVTRWQRYDIVHAFNVPSALPMRCTRATKRVLSVHGVYWEQIGMIHSRAAARFATVAESTAFGWSDTLTTDSKKTASAYRELGYDLVHLPSAIDPTMFDGIVRAGEQTGKIVAYVGRDSYEKGTDILRGIEPDIHGAVRYCTHMKWRDAMSVLAGASVMVLPSRAESLPTAVKEAFYLRVPVVAMSVGGVPELIEDGKTGFLIEPGNARRMTEVVNGILDGSIPTQEVVEAAHSYVMQHMTWDAVMPRYEVTYKELLTGGRGTNQPN
ncbi:MAG: glycosyltransferase family 4 protein [Thaumarchaeota archaeon]|nr:glycosyltransferase family 4 protein [Nitrososphaerota archaeon]